MVKSFADQLNSDHPAASSAPLPPLVQQLLQEAVAVYSQANRAEAILWSAQAMYPECLPVYFALYKFYFYKGRLHDAERATRLGLAAASRQAGFDVDWHRLTIATVDWSDTLGPQHFYLFSLKALAFIYLRLDRRSESQAILSKLAQIDPGDSVGASVIRDLVAGSEN
jgi:tetratricopeptide (TPR) repeat protein